MQFDKKYAHNMGLKYFFLLAQITRTTSPGGSLVNLERKLSLLTLVMKYTNESHYNAISAVFHYGITVLGTKITFFRPGTEITP
jgi:hypothetical protein